MRTPENSSKSTAITRGELEAAGLGEVAYFLKKARQQIAHAKFALESVDFSRSVEMLDNAQARISAMENLIVGMGVDLIKAEQAALLCAEEAEEENEN